jgi:predicted MFS family arabinose efflux permease
LPYLLLGLFAGVFIDRRRRWPILIWASLGRAVLLASVPAFWVLGRLNLPVLIAVLIAFGSLTVVAVAATQSFLPAVVPRSKIVAANARIDQSDAVAQTVGPAAGGALVGLLGAPLALVIDALSFLLDAALIRRMATAEAAPSRLDQASGVRAEIRAGIEWTYRHRTLAPLSLSTHVWFFANGVALTVLVPLALRGLGLSSLVFGLLFAVVGVATLAGALFATRVGVAWGTGRTIVWCRVGYALPWIAIALTTSSAVPAAATTAVLFAALAVYGVAGGVENANEVGYRQLVTPPEVLGRVTSTVRSVNRASAFVGALIGGALATALGYQVGLLLGAAAFVTAFLIAVTTPVRSASVDATDRTEGSRE